MSTGTEVVAEIEGFRAIGASTTEESAEVEVWTRRGESAETAVSVEAVRPKDGAVAGRGRNGRGRESERSQPRIGAANDR